MYKIYEKDYGTDDKDTCNSTFVHLYFKFYFCYKVHSIYVFISCQELYLKYYNF